MLKVAQFRQQPEAILSRRALSSVGVHECELTCATCNLRETCLTGGMTEADLQRAEHIVNFRHMIKRGERLFSAGAPFKSLYAIRSGFFKTNVIDLEGREQVTGFFMSGELLGMEGFGSGCCENNAIALEDSMVCAMPYALIDEVSRKLPSLQRRLHLVLAREITRGHGMMMLLGAMSAEERLATFLVNLSRRFLRRGYSGSSFVLRMSRDEIGSYLGLKLETVSRIFSMFHKRGLLEVNGKEVCIVDIEGLEGVFSRGEITHERRSASITTGT